MEGTIIHHAILEKKAMILEKQLIWLKGFSIYLKMIAYNIKLNLDARKNRKYQVSRSVSLHYRNKCSL